MSQLLSGVIFSRVKRTCSIQRVRITQNYHLCCQISFQIYCHNRLTNFGIMQPKAKTYISRDSSKIQGKSGYTGNM
jgi:hypothetical protein